MMGKITCDICFIFTVVAWLCEKSCENGFLHSVHLVFSLLHCNRSSGCLVMMKVWLVTLCTSVTFYRGSGCLTMAQEWLLHLVRLFHCFRGSRCVGMVQVCLVTLITGVVGLWENAGTLLMQSKKHLQFRSGQHLKVASRCHVRKLKNKNCRHPSLVCACNIT